MSRKTRVVEAVDVSGAEGRMSTLDLAELETGLADRALKVVELAVGNG